MAANEQDEPESMPHRSTVERRSSGTLIGGYAIVCRERGDGGRLKEYVDLHGDHNPEDAMLIASVDFMLHQRRFSKMHRKDNQGNEIKKGTVDSGFLLTEAIAALLHIGLDRTGLIIPATPEPDVVEKVERGEYRAVVGRRSEASELRSRRRRAGYHSRQHAHLSVRRVAADV